MRGSLLYILLLFFLSKTSFAIRNETLTCEPERSEVYLKSGEFKKYFDEGNNYIVNNPNRAYRVALDLQRIAIKENKVELTFLADFFLGRCYYFFNDAPKAIKVFNVALKMAEKQGWVEAQIKSTSYIAATFSSKKNFLLTEKHYLRALSLATANKKLKYVLDIYERLGFMLATSGRPEADMKGKKYFERGLNLSKQLKDTNALATFYVRLGLIGNRGAPTDSSIASIHIGIGLLKGRDDVQTLVLAYKSLGDAYYTLDRNDSSLYYYKQVHALNRKMGQARVTAVSACDVAYMYGTIGKLKELDVYADSAVYFAKRDRSGEARFYVYKWLADVYKNVGKSDLAIKYYQMQAYLLDSSLRSGNGEALTTAGMQSDFDGQLEVLQLKQQREREIQKKEKEEQAFRSRMYLIGFFIVLISLIIIFREFRINKKQRIIISQQHEDVSSQKVILEVKNKEITDSINYALRIQSALLPNPDDLFKLLNGSFIYYAPKDIVSGDFYWFYKRDNFIYIACGDCTGHGVPGALMSVLGINLLSDIIDGNKASEPAKILDLLRAGVIRALNKDNESGLYKDGMDIALVRMDTKNMNCVFAGANNPIYHISGGSLAEYKANSQPVGYSHELKPFTQTEFKIAKTDHLILFTDGFADQFGGSSNKKFMYKRFKEVLIGSIEKNKNDIDKILMKNFDDWKGQVEQIDDVCVLGIKI